MDMQTWLLMTTTTATTSSGYSTSVIIPSLCSSALSDKQQRKSVIRVGNPLVVSEMEQILLQQCNRDSIARTVLRKFKDGRGFQRF